MRIERFVIKHEIDEIENDFRYGSIYSKRTIYQCVIYDRLKEKVIVTISTNDEKLNNELAEAILTMLNIKYVGVEEE